MISTGAFYLLQASGGSSSPMYTLLIDLAAGFAIFYFLIIRPQQKQRKQHETALRSLQKGDEIVTSGGIVGQVIHIRETMKDGTPVKAMDDQVTIKSAESRLVIERGRIARVTSVRHGETTTTTTPAS